MIPQLLSHVLRCLALEPVSLGILQSSINSMNTADKQGQGHGELVNETCSEGTEKGSLWDTHHANLAWCLWWCKPAWMLGYLLF